MMRTDRWIKGGALFGVVCSLVFLVVFFMTFLPLFLWLMVGAWLVAGALWRWRTIRGMVRSLQQQESQQQKATSTTRIWSVLKGISLILIAVVVETSVSNLHQEWWNFFAEPFVGGCACFGIALIVHALRRKIKHEKTRA